MADFCSEVDELIIERQNAMTEIKKILFTQTYNLQNKHFEILAVHSITMMYSLWEGFINKVFSLYISEIKKEQINIFSFQDTIIAHYFNNTFKQFKEFPQKASKQVNFFLELKNFYNKEDSNSLSLIVNTESNVGFDVLNKLLEIFHIQPFKEQWEPFCYPNTNLKDSLRDFLRYRNSIAHGGDISSEEKITQAVYEKYEKLVLHLMYDIQLHMDNALNNKTYLKHHTIN